MKKPADFERAKELGQVVWTIDCDVVEIFQGGAN